jgi:sugar phosphate isomerase/epimerase
MQLGISTYTYTWAIGVPGSEPEKPMTVLSLISKAAGFKVDCVQLADNLPLNWANKEEMSHIRQFAQNHHINIEIGGRGLTDENLHRHIEMAAYFGSPIVRMVIDGNNYYPEMDLILSVIRNGRSELESDGIILALENHDRLHASAFRDIVETSGSNNVAICLDCVNSIGIGEDIETVLNCLAPYTVNLHIKDFSVRRVSHKMGFVIEGTPAGQGLLNLPRIVERLKPYGRCTSGILELWTPPAENLRETLQLEEVWARASISYMKQIFNS